MLSLFMPILADAAASSAPAGASGGSAPAASPFNPMFFVWIIAIVAIFYFMLIRPQKKKEQAVKDMLSKIQKGDRVITIGGIHGEVDSVKEDYVILLVDREHGHTIKFRRGAIQEVLARDSGSAEDKR